MSTFIFDTLYPEWEGIDHINISEFDKYRDDALIDRSSINKKYSINDTVIPCTNPKESKFINWGSPSV